ncbi:MAG: hypothetical protein JKY54_11405 [Flavobacteriales bacterium]|nr:hypothetical protein [Flavobacteriales bacterium]
MAKWNGKSRGGLIGYSFFVYTIRWFGVGAAYGLLALVYPFYYLFESSKKANLIKFYKTVGLDESKAKKTARKNFKLIGQCLIDRIAFMIGKEDFYTFSMEGEEHLIAMEAGGKGGLLLSAHLGNWEIAGNLLKKREINSTVNVLMLDAEHKKIKEFLDKQTNGALFNIIPITDDFSYLIKLKQAASRNELICLHADRFMEGAKTVEKEFFGEKVKLPAGPFELAKLLRIPVSIVFAVKTTKKHYHLSATELIENSSAEEVSDSYISALENRVNEYPEQWFNYFDYFESNTSN